MPTTTTYTPTTGTTRCQNCGQMITRTYLDQRWSSKLDGDWCRDAKRASFMEGHDHVPMAERTAAIYDPTAMTAAELRQLADLLDMQGQQVRLTHPDGTEGIVGELGSVYVTDGIAVNVVANPTHFSFGPLYGSTVELAK